MHKLLPPICHVWKKPEYINIKFLHNPGLLVHSDTSCCSQNSFLGTFYCNVMLLFPVYFWLNYRTKNGFNMLALLYYHDS